MKISAEKLEEIRTAVAPFDTEELREKYRTGNFARAEFVKDLDRRYRFDISYLAHVSSLFTQDDDLTDEHYYTALKRVIPAL